MNDYIHTQLAAERAESLRAEARAHRLGRQVLTRRAARKASRVSHQAARSLRTAH
ncbi:MAG: hypothetical protein ACRDQB_14795 [Thermocrispum sp.]